MSDLTKEKKALNDAIRMRDDILSQIRDCYKVDLKRFIAKQISDQDLKIIALMAAFIQLELVINELELQIICQEKDT